MLINIKNKDTLIFDDFRFKCSIGKHGLSTKKMEGDKCTPKGIFSLGPIYYRSDRVIKPKSKFLIKEIKKNMGWCDDPKSIHYNSEILINKKIGCEKLFRKDSKYDYILVIKYNTKKKIPYKGSAIFLHLTTNYKPTLGCIALKKKDFLILLKVIKTYTKIKIF